MTRAFTWLQGIPELFKGKLLALFALGYSSGMGRALIWGTLGFWLSEEGISRTTVGLFVAAGTPYALKFLWSPLVDRLPIPLLSRLLGQRRSWLAVSQLALIFFIGVLATMDPTKDIAAMGAVAVLIGFLGATQDIAIDAFRIDSLDDKNQGNGAMMYVFGYRLSVLAAGAGALMISARMGWTTAYFVLGGTIVIGLLATLMSSEPERGTSAEQRHEEARIRAYLEDHPFLKGRLADLAASFHGTVIAPFAEFMSRRGWWMILLFAILFKVGDALAGAMTNKFVEELFVHGKEGAARIEVKDSLAAIYKGVGFFATLAGTAVSGPLLYALGLYRTLLLAGILQLLSNFMFAAQAMVGESLSFLALTISVENFTTGIGMIVFIAYLSGLCNKAYTATQYALLSSLAVFSTTIISAGSGAMADALDWFWFFNATAIAAIPGLFLLVWLGRHGLVSKENGKSNGATEA